MLHVYTRWVEGQCLFGDQCRDLWGLPADMDSACSAYATKFACLGEE